MSADVLIDVSAFRVHIKVFAVQVHDFVQLVLWL